MKEQIVWLNSEMLTKYFVGGATRIRNAMKALQKQMEDYITVYEKTLVLDKSALDEFSKKSGLAFRSELVKNEEWLSTRELLKYVYGSFNKVYKALKEYSIAHKQDIQLKQHTKRYVLCLNKSAIKDFIKVTGLISRDDNDIVKNSDWLSVFDLLQYYVCTDDKIYNALNKLQHKIPEAIQYRKTGSNMAICLHKNYIEKVAELANLILKQNVEDVKDGDWLNSIELLKYVSVDKTKLRNKMRELQKSMPYALKYMYHKPQPAVICLHKDYIQEFLDKAGLISREAQEIKTEDWLSAEDLKCFIKADKRHILKLLKDTQNIFSDRIIAIKKNTDGRKELCLKRKYVKTLARVANIEIKNKDSFKIGIIKIKHIEKNRTIDTNVGNIR